MARPNPKKTAEPEAGGAKMQTIAEHLNLSIATVSRALRRVPGINAETRARVFETAAQLGYRLPQSYRAQDLQNTSLQHVGVMIQTPQAHAVAPYYLVGMSEAAMGLNASLVVHYMDPENCERLMEPKFQPRAMQSGLLGGVIFVFRWPKEVIREVTQRMPAVSIMHRYPGVSLDMVGVENQEGVDLLVTHLHNLGHEKIGFLGRNAELHWAIQRFGGYVASLTRLGMEYRSKWAVDIDTEALTSPKASMRSALEQTERIAREEGVRAWICSSETVGQALRSWFVSKGLRVPEDVSVTGFHRSDAGTPDEAPLTSVTSSYQAMGAAALKRLLYRIKNPAESMRSILFPFDLFNGETVGPPPKG